MERMRKETKEMRSRKSAAVSGKRQEGDMAASVAEKENREHKDSLFVDLFYEDETAKGSVPVRCFPHPDGKKSVGAESEGDKYQFPKVA